MALKTPRCGKQASLHFTLLVLSNGESSCDDAKKGISGGVTLIRASLSRVVLAYESGYTLPYLISIESSSESSYDCPVIFFEVIARRYICLYPSCLLT